LKLIYKNKWIFKCW